MVIAAPPASRMACTVWSALTMSGSDNFAPSFAKAIAYALAIFPPPPVMMTDLSLKRMIFVLSLGYHGASNIRRIDSQ